MVSDLDAKRAAGRRRVRHGGIALLVVAALGVGQAQYGYTPSFDWTVLQSQAYGLELVAQRLRVVEAFEAPLDEDLLEQVEAMLEEDAPRFLGTLAARDGALAAALVEALEAVEEAVEEGEDAHEAVGEARDLLERAYTALVPSAVRAAPAFVGALISDLSFGEGGVAEGYEEAADGETYEFTSGWAALQRVKELWNEVAWAADARHRADIQEMLVFLDGVYPSAEPPDAIVGSPEEAEAPAQRLVGLLEPVVDANLFAGRDMPALAAHLAQAIEPACAAYAAGDDARAQEIAIAVGDLYLKHLGDFVGFMAPETHEEAAEAILALTGLAGEGADEDDEGEEAEAADADEGEDEAAEEEAALDDPAGVCRDLQDALQEAREALGG